MIQVSGEHFGVCAFRAFEFLSWCHLDRWFIRDIGNEEVHCYVLAIHMFVNPFFNVTRHGIRIHVAPVLKKQEV